MTEAGRGKQINLADAIIGYLDNDFGVERTIELCTEDYIGKWGKIDLWNFVPQRINAVLDNRLQTDGFITDIYASGYWPASQWTPEQREAFSDKVDAVIDGLIAVQREQAQ